MARPLRVQFEGAVYHVTARGNNRDEIFEDDRDRYRFLETLGEAADRYGLAVHGYCLMPNHYHLLLSTPRGNLSQAVGWLQVTYTVRFNRRHRRCGHVLQGRFKAHLVEADEYASQLVRYVHLNPVRPRDRRKAIPADRRAYLDGYRWSSHRAYAGLSAKGETPPLLSLEWLSYWDEHGGRGGDGPAAVARARRAYRRDVAGAFGQVVASPLEELRGGLVLGGEKLWKKAKALLAAGEKAATEGDGEALRWRRRQGQSAARRRAVELTEDEQDDRVKLWARATLGGERLIALAREHGYQSGSGVLNVIRRLERQSAAERPLAAKLRSLWETFNSTLCEEWIPLKNPCLQHLRPHFDCV